MTSVTLFSVRLYTMFPICVKEIYVCTLVGDASLLSKPFWYSMCNEAELFSQLYSFDYIGSLVSAKARRGDKFKAHLLSHTCVCDSLSPDKKSVIVKWVMSTCVRPLTYFI